MFLNPEMIQSVNIEISILFICKIVDALHPLCICLYGALQLSATNAMSNFVNSHINIVQHLNVCHQYIIEISRAFTNSPVLLHFTLFSFLFVNTSIPY